MRLNLFFLLRADSSNAGYQGEEAWGMSLLTAGLLFYFKADFSILECCFQEQLSFQGKWNHVPRDSQITDWGSILGSQESMDVAGGL